MNTAELSTAYQRLYAAAEAISDATPLDAEQRADVDWTLCHIALSDRLLTDTARSILDHTTGAAPNLVVNNRPAMDPTAISAMTTTTTHPERVAAVRHHATQLLTLLEQLPDDAGQTPLTLKVHDRTGQHVSDTELTWVELIELRGHQHIPAHADRLHSYLTDHTP